MSQQITIENETYNLLKKCMAKLPDTTPVHRTYDDVIWNIAKEYLSEDPGYNIAAIVTVSESDPDINKTRVRLLCDRHDEIQGGDIVSLVLVSHR